jgi:glycerol kinase
MILAIDQGTTGTTCFVYDERFVPIGRGHREFTQHFPQPGWVEHDAGEIWSVTQAVAGEALEDAGARAGDLAAVGIANQRETVSGTPLRGSLCTTRSSGRTAVRRRAVRSYAPPGASR